MSKEKTKIQYSASTLHISKMHYNGAFIIIPINLSFFFLMSVRQNVPALSFDVPAWGCFMTYEVIMFSFILYKFQQPTEMLG